MNFSKWQGLGNDFIILDEIDLQIDDLPGLAVRLCDRHFGIGADGLCLLESSDAADMRMRLINSDGSEAEMCGNLVRCVAKHLYQQGICKKVKMEIETLAGIMRPELILADGEITSVRVEMATPEFKRGLIPVVGEPEEEALCIEVSAGGKIYQGTCLSMGNPHLVIFVDDVEAVPLKEHGSLLEKNELFPRKINVEFVQAITDSKARMRVWERGAGITLACGTGSCAAAAAGILHGFFAERVEVELDGGVLLLEWPGKSGPVYMTGSAQKVFSGVIDL